jgi:hypothetical protein
MAIWIGEAGGIRIGRASFDRVYSYISPSEVDTGSKRFGFQDASNNLITGDRIWIRRVNNIGAAVTDLLDFVATSGWADGVQRNDGQWYVNVDGVGGIRLYDTWPKAIAGSAADAISLATPAQTYRVSYELVVDTAQYLAQTVGWTLNTDREVADFTSLGDAFKQQKGTIVSGSGELDCFFDTTWRAGAPDYTGYEESAIYLHQLVLRQEVGSTFTGVFLMKRTDSVPISTLVSSTEARKELFYVADCVITAVATELVADQPIHSKITFVTTGQIRLLFDYPAGYLLLEQPPNDKVLQESGFGILLEVPA